MQTAGARDKHGETAMGREVLEACLPWIALLAAAAIGLVLVERLVRCRPRPWRLARLHRDQVGGVQSLSFVVVLPFFIMIMLFIVQVSQLMIGTIVVHYAAYAAARGAVVWIPARLPLPEQENCLNYYYVDPEATDQTPPSIDGPSDGGLTYVIAPGSPKYEKILSAAVLACTPICPSRDLGLSPQGRGIWAADILDRAYRAMAPNAGGGARLTPRLQNKLAYAMSHTWIKIRFYHSSGEAPLEWSPLVTDIREQDYFQKNELGWQDQIEVTVRHDLSLLPGPAHFLRRNQPAAGSATDEVYETIGESKQLEGVYVWPLWATATLGSEGEKSVIPYEYPVY